MITSTSLWFEKNPFCNSLIWKRCWRKYLVNSWKYATKETTPLSFNCNLCELYPESYRKTEPLFYCVSNPRYPKQPLPLSAVHLHRNREFEPGRYFLLQKWRTRAQVPLSSTFSNRSPLPPPPPRLPPDSGLASANVRRQWEERDLVVFLLHPPHGRFPRMQLCIALSVISLQCWVHTHLSVTSKISPTAGTGENWRAKEFPLIFADEMRENFSVSPVKGGALLFRGFLGRRGHG